MAGQAEARFLFHGRLAGIELKEPRRIDYSKPGTKPVTFRNTATEVGEVELQGQAALDISNLRSNLTLFAL